MAQVVSSFITRRELVAGLALTAAATAVLAEADKAYAQDLTKVYTSGWGASSPSRRWWITSATRS